jgi:hypothetical protein
MDELERADVLGIDSSELDAMYERGERLRREDDRLIERIKAGREEEFMRQQRQRWDDDIRAEIDRRQREGLPYEHILAYFE